MKVLVKKHEFVKTLINEFPIEFPDETICWQEWNHRVLWMIIPQWTTWNERVNNKPEEIWEYKIIKLNTSTNSSKAIETGILRVNPNELESILLETTTTSDEKALQQKVLNYLMKFYFKKVDRITIEQFKGYYVSLIEDINSLIAETSD